MPNNNVTAGKVSWRESSQKIEVNPVGEKAWDVLANGEKMGRVFTNGSKFAGKKGNEQGPWKKDVKSAARWVVFGESIAYGSPMMEAIDAGMALHGIEPRMGDEPLTEGKKKITHKLFNGESEVEELAYTTNDPLIVIGRSPVNRKVWQILFLSDKGPAKIQGDFSTRTKAMEAWKRISTLVDGPTPKQTAKATAHLKKGVLAFRSNEV